MAALEASDNGPFSDRALELSRRAVEELEGSRSRLDSSEHAERHAFKREIGTTVGMQRG
jgi:hypothetical protein